MGIRRNGAAYGIWESEDSDDCIRAFLVLTGTPEVVVIRVRPSPHYNSASAN